MLPVSKVDLEFVYILDLCYVNYYKDDLFNALFKGKLFNRKTVDPLRHKWCI